MTDVSPFTEQEYLAHARRINEAPNKPPCELCGIPAESHSPGGEKDAKGILHAYHAKILCPVACSICKTITISLEIENTYELYDDVITTKTDEVIPAPPTMEEGTSEYDDWAYDHIYGFTGVGHEDGDSWYDVTVTACSDPEMVGRTFEFGY